MTPGYEIGLRDLYAEQFYFSDPLLTTTHWSELESYFSKAPYKYKNPHIQIEAAYEDNDSAMVLWKFRAKKLGLSIEIDGVWHLIYGPNDKIIKHVDYWDFYAQVAEKIPLLGFLFKIFKKILT
jgi:hypothetical protein